MKRVKFVSLFLPALLFSLFSAPSVGAETQTIGVEQDTYANKAYPDDPKGSVGSVTISNKFTDRLGFLQFKSPDLPEGAIIDRGLLKIYVFERHYAATAKVNVGPVTGDWQQSTLTWNNKPTINQTLAIEAEVSLTENGWKEILVTHLVQKWHDGSLANKGLFIYPLGFLYGTAETEFAFSFKSKEADNPSVIEVEYHLEPSPTPTPEPQETPLPTPAATLAVQASPASGQEATPSPEPEETPAPEATKSGLVLNLTTGQSIVAAMIFIALVGTLVAFIVYFARQKEDRKVKKEPKEKKEKKED